MNRGLAILGNTLFMVTIDARLVAVDARDGKPLWRTAVAEPTDGYAMTMAPLVVKDKVIVGVAGGEYGIRGFIAAFDAVTGKEVWRFYTISVPGEPGHETWSGDDWKTGGAPVWVPGSYDPVLNLTYWGTGNPGPDWTAGQTVLRTASFRVRGDVLLGKRLKIVLSESSWRGPWHPCRSSPQSLDCRVGDAPVLSMRLGPR